MQAATEPEVQIKHLGNGVHVVTGDASDQSLIEGLKRLRHTFSDQLVCYGLLSVGVTTDIIAICCSDNRTSSPGFSRKHSRKNYDKSFWALEVDQLDDVAYSLVEFLGEHPEIDIVHLIISITNEQHHTNVVLIETKNKNV